MASLSFFYHTIYRLAQLVAAVHCFPPLLVCSMEEESREPQVFQVQGEELIFWPQWTQCEEVRLTITLPEL